MVKRMLKELVKILLSTICLCYVLQVTALAAEQDKSKIIYFILDDSGSMVDKKSRWITADYAIKALIATMDENDMFYIANMGQYLNEKHEEDVYYRNLNLESNGKDGSWMTENSSSYKNLVYENYASHTCKYVLDIIEKDIENKKKAYPEDQYEYWIVWMTDGEIDCDACKKIEKEKEKDFSINYDKLKKWKKDCHASLIHISINDSSVERISDDTERIWMIPAVSDSGSGSRQSILEAVTEAGNHIYNRMKFQKTDTQAVVDIPVSKLLVLEQFVGTATESKKQNNKPQILMDELRQSVSGKTVEIVNKESDMEESETMCFSGRTTTPKNEGKEVDTIYQALIGKIYQYNRSYRGESNGPGRTELSLSAKDAYYEVYYEPDLNVNPVFILEDKEYRLNEDNKFILEEGEGTLEICLEDSQGSKFNTESELLQLDKFSIEMLSDAGEQVALNRMDTGQGLVYSVPELLRGKYTFSVKTSWGETWDYMISVIERKLPIVIQRTDMGEIMDPVLENRISFSIKDSEDDAERNLLIHAEASIKDGDTKWNYKLQRDENDSSKWDLITVWADKEDHICAEKVNFMISAERKYEDGNFERAEESFEIDVKASPETVEVNYDSVDDKYYYPWEVGQVLDNVTYKCGSVLTSDQERLISGKLYENADSDRFHFEKARVKVVNYIKWIFMNRHKAVITGEVHYQKWNRDDEGEWSVSINIKPFPRVLAGFIVIAAMMLLIWIIYIIFKPSFVKKYITNRISFYMIYGGSSIADLKVSCGERIAARCIPFRNWKKYKIDGGGGRLGLDDIELKMRKGSEPETWAIVNPEELPESCEIGNGKISKNNFVIKEYRPFTMKDKGGHTWTLCWSKGGKKL